MERLVAVDVDEQVAPGLVQLLERGGLSEIVIDKEPGFEETALVNVYARRGAQ